MVGSIKPPDGSLKEHHPTIFLSTDGKIRYTLLEGKELYNFLKSEDGKRRSFHVDIDENGDKIGIEAEPEQIRSCSEQHERDKYRNKVKKKLNISIVSANAVVSIPGEDDIELIETLVDEEGVYQGVSRCHIGFDDTRRICLYYPGTRQIASKWRDDFSSSWIKGYAL